LDVLLPAVMDFVWLPQDVRWLDLLLLDLFQQIVDNFLVSMDCPELFLQRIELLQTILNQLSLKVEFSACLL
jgi:hypothetical protein